MENLNKNDVDTIIKDLKRQIAEKDLQIDRMKWKIRNLRHSNRQLNRAHIVKNHTFECKEASYRYNNEVLSRRIRELVQGPKSEDTQGGGCCGGGCHSGE